MCRRVLAAVLIIPPGKEALLAKTLACALAVDMPSGAKLFLRVMTTPAKSVAPRLTSLRIILSIGLKSPIFGSF